LGKDGYYTANSTISWTYELMKDAHATFEAASKAAFRAASLRLADLLAATRYAVMMLRYARTETQWRKFNGPLVMPKIVFV